jgi:WD40 repeat protein
MGMRTCCHRSAARGYANTSVLAHTGGVRSVDFLDNILVSGSSDRTLRLWDAAVRAYATLRLSRLGAVTDRRRG